MFGLVEQVLAELPDEVAPTSTQKFSATGLPGFLKITQEGGFLSFVLGWIIKLVFVFAALFVFFHLVLGALKWIQSGGEKEKVEKARQEITTAVVGFIILIMVFGLIVLIETIFNFGLGISRPVCIPKFAVGSTDCPK